MINTSHVTALRKLDDTIGILRSLSTSTTLHLGLLVNPMIEDLTVVRKVMVRDEELKAVLVTNFAHFLDRF